MQFASEVTAFGERSRELLDALGVPAPARPEGHLELPSDLSSLHDSELGQHLSYWASMSAYLHHKVAVLEGSLILTKQRLEDDTQVRIYSRQDKSMAERKVAVSSMRTIRELSERVATIEADLKVLKSVVNGYDMKNSAISREISRRSSERSLRDGR